MNSMPSSNWPGDGSLLLQSLETERNRRLTEDRLKYHRPEDLSIGPRKVPGRDLGFHLAR